MGSRQWVKHERLETLPFQCRTKQVDITVLPLQLLVRFPLDLGKRFDTSVFFNTRSMNRNDDSGVSLVSVRFQMMPLTRCPPKRTRTITPGWAASEYFSST